MSVTTICPKKRALKHVSDIVECWNDNELQPSAQRRGHWNTSCQICKAIFNRLQPSAQRRGHWNWHAYRYSIKLTCYNHLPKEEGIETFFLIHIKSMTLVLQPSAQRRGHWNAKTTGIPISTRTCYNHLPKEEGIETCKNLCLLSRFLVTTICPKKRALKPSSQRANSASETLQPSAQRRGHWNWILGRIVYAGYCYNHLPKEEGIETNIGHYWVLERQRYNHLPKEEGIETIWL